MPGRCDKCFPDAPAFCGANRNILQVRFIARQPPGNGYSLRIICVHSAGSGIDHAWQFVGIGGFKLGKAPVFKQNFCQGVIQGKPLQNIFVGGRRSAWCFF